MKLLYAIALVIPALVRAEINIPDITPPLPPKSEYPSGVAEDIANKGYHVSEIRDDVYWINGGEYHVMAVKTGRGVIVVDAPEPLPFFPPMNVLGAVEEIAPGLPITHLIYSHGHSDHIGGASLIKDAFPKVKIIAHEKTAELLARVKDHKRPVPNFTFGTGNGKSYGRPGLHSSKNHQASDEYLINSGGKQIKLSYHGDSHMPGNIFIHAPKANVLMVVDVLFPGWVPFRRLALSSDIDGWVKGHLSMLEYVDSETKIIAGHVTKLGSKADLALQLEYVGDIIKSVGETYLDPTTLMGGGVGNSAVDTYDSVHGPYSAFDTAAKWSLFSAFYDAATMRCATVLDEKYIEGPSSGDNAKALAGAEAFNFSNCEAYFTARRLGVIATD